MPIVIQEPTTPNAFGPGFRLVAFSDTAVELPPTAQWRVEAYFPTSEETPFSAGTVQNLQGDPDVRLTTDWLVINGRVQVPITHGDMLNQDVRWVIKLTADGTTVIDQTSFTAKWDGQTGILGNLATATGTTQGFTETDRVVLMQITPWLLWDLVGEFSDELADLVRNKLRTAPARVQIDPDLGGEGSFARPATGPFVRWVGIEWQIISWPIGLGFDEGNPETVEIDYGQISLTRRAQDGTEMIDQTRYVRSYTESWYWGTDEPSRIFFYFLPGTLVRFWYLEQLDPIGEARRSLTRPAPG